MYYPVFLQSPTQDDSGIFTSTACTEFPPDNGANVVNRQQCLSTAVSNHPKCCIATAVSPTCPTNNSTCRQTDDGGSGVPSSEQNLEENSEEGEGSSETATLVPQTTNVTCGVIQRRVFDVSSLSGSVNHAVCPIHPKLDVCMLVCTFQPGPGPFPSSFSV